MSYRIVLIPQARTQPDSNTDATEKSAQATAESTPPVTEGNHRTIEIETIGEQGDGIARVERGYVIIVPDTDPDERVEIEITSVTDTVAFAEVVERYEYN